MTLSTCESCGPQRKTTEVGIQMCGMNLLKRVAGVSEDCTFVTFAGFLVCLSY